jgi:oligopeptide transport system substrate-binding protein
VAPYWPVRLASVLVLALVGLLTACGPRESRVQRATRDKILLIGNGSEPRSLDPHIVSGVPEHHVLMSLFEGLATESQNGEGVDPGCAERWESNERKDRWTFYLRPTARWSNGDPLRASDFVFSYQRMLTAKLGSEYGAMLYVLKGGQEFYEGKTSDFSSVGVKALDERRLELTLSGPTPHLPLMLPHYCFFPVHPATVLKFGAMDERPNPWVRPGRLVGNGPFQLKEWRFQHFIEVERNPHYWDAATVKLNGIRYFPISNLATEERLFRDQQLHITELLPTDKIPWWRAQRPDVYRGDPELSVYFYRINTKRGSLIHPKVRRALSLAIDRQAIATNIGRGGQPVAQSITPPCAGYVGPNTALFDPEAGRRLLAEAGFPGGKGIEPIQILFNTTESHKAIAESIQQMWRAELGITGVTLNNQDWQVYLQSQQNLEYDVCRAGWTADYEDPMSFLDIWTTTNGQNQTGWGTPEYDGLIAAAQACADQKERLALLKKAETLLLEEMPVIPIYFRVNTYLVHGDVKGWMPTPLNNHPFKHVDLLESR